MSDQAIRVVLADDHAVVRAGLRALLEAEPDIEVAGEAANGREAIELSARLSPDVIVMDLSMDGIDGLTAARTIVGAGPRPRVLVLTMHGEEEYLLPVLEAGAAGYLMKSAADRELINAVRTVARGDVYVQPTAARVLARGVRKKDAESAERARFDRLTDREREVFRLVAQGYSGPEIGRTLLISPKTVDTYKLRVNEKLGLAHRSEYVRLALRLGLLTPE